MFDKTKAKVNKIAENVKLGTENLKSEAKEIPIIFNAFFINISPLIRL